MIVENKQINETLDIETQIDNKLENLWNKIWNKYKEWEYAYEVQYMEWLEGEEIPQYYTKINWEVLNIPLDKPKDMINFLKLTEKLLTLYKKNWFNPEKNPFQLDNVNIYTSNKIEGNNEPLVIEVDNRNIIDDTDYLSMKSFTKTIAKEIDWIWVSYDKIKTYMTRYVEFLNNIIKKEEQK